MNIDAAQIAHSGFGRVIDGIAVQRSDYVHE
jgi:hypothetical protein